MVSQSKGTHERAGFLPAAGSDGPRFAARLAALATDPGAAILGALEDGPRRLFEVAAATSLEESAAGDALRELDVDGLVVRRVDSGPPLRVLYELSDAGTQISPALHALGGWARAASRP